MSDSVYFVAALDCNRVKIGFSRDPVKRIDGLHTGSPLPLTTLAIFPGTMCDESTLHAAFRHLRVNREWFDLGPELCWWIQRFAAEPEAGYALAREETRHLASPKTEGSPILQEWGREVWAGTWIHAPRTEAEIAALARQVKREPNPHRQMMLATALSACVLSLPAGDRAGDPSSTPPGEGA